MAQNLSEGLIRPTLQTEKKYFGVRKTQEIPYFQAPFTDYISSMFN